MKVEVAAGIEDLKRQFEGSPITVREDGNGGAYVIIEAVTLSPKFEPQSTWMGFQIPAQYPYADIYPVFIAEHVRRSDGVSFVAPVTTGHTFEGRSAIQVSRRNGAAQNGFQKVPAKLLKILDYLEKMP